MDELQQQFFYIGGLFLLIGTLAGMLVWRLVWLLVPLLLVLVSLIPPP